MARKWIDEEEEDEAVVDHSSEMMDDESLFLQENRKKKVHLGLERSKRATVDQVLDQRTFLILEKLKNRGILSQLHGTVSTGKEANVYHGATVEGHEIVVKVFRTSILSFKDRARYIEGEFRFRHGYTGSGNPRKMVTQWAEKEYRNLRRIWSQGIRCPTPLELRGHVIAMSFLGRHGEASPRFKEADLPQDVWRRLYVETISLMRALYQDCRLVHGDFSEYNLILHDNHVYVFDVSQAVEHDHEHSLDFLKRDCINITKFFQKVLGRTQTEGQDPAVAAAKDATVCENSYALQGDLEAVSSDQWEVLPIRDLFDVIVKVDVFGGGGNSSQVEEGNGGNNQPDGIDSLGCCSGGAVVGLFEPFDVRSDLTRQLQRFDNLCDKMEKFLTEFWDARRHVAKEGNQSAKDQVDEQVFLNTWIPSNLHQISDLSLLDEAMARRSPGDASQLLCSSLLNLETVPSDTHRVLPGGGHASSDMITTEKAQKSTEKAQNCVATTKSGKNVKMDVVELKTVDKNDASSQREKVRDGGSKSGPVDREKGGKKERSRTLSVSTDSEETSCDETGDGSTDSDEDEGSDSEDQNERRKKTPKPSYIDGKFTGYMPEGIDKKDWKKLVKEEKRETRKKKMPKHVKKRHEKKGKKQKK